MKAPNVKDVVDIILKHIPQIQKDKNILESKIKHLIEICNNQQTVYSANLAFVAGVFNMLNFVFSIFIYNEVLENELKLFRENTFEEDLIEFGFKFKDSGGYLKIDYSGQYIEVFINPSLNYLCHIIFSNGDGNSRIDTTVTNIKDVKKFIKQILKIYKSLNKIQKINEQN